MMLLRLELAPTDEIYYFCFKFYWWNGHPKQTGGPVYLSVLATVRANKVEAVGHISPKTENKKKRNE